MQKEVLGTAENAYMQMRMARAAVKQPLKWGTTAFIPAQWRSYFHTARARWARGGMHALCEVGMGPGYSAILFLVATTGSQWQQGADLYELDLGVSPPGKGPFSGYVDGYAAHKNATLAHIYAQFGARAHFLWGDSRRSLRQLARQNVTCGIVHVDGLHSRLGVYNDLKALRALCDADTLVLLDDLQSKGVAQGVADAHKLSFELLAAHTVESSSLRAAYETGMADEAFEAEVSEAAFKMLKPNAELVLKKFGIGRFTRFVRPP